MLESCIKAEHWLVHPQGQIQFPVIMYRLSDWLEVNIASQLEALSTEGSCQSPAEMSFIVRHTVHYGLHTTLQTQP